MDDDLGFRTVRQPMTLAPREVVMILDVEQHFDAESTRHLLVNQFMIRRGIAAHELHGGPILLPGISGEVEPGEVRQFLR